MNKLYYGTSLYHHGIKGQKWGIRRYQNEDGSLTEAGRKRYSKMTDDQVAEDIKKQVDKRQKKMQRQYKDYHVRFNSEYTYIGPESKKAAEKYIKDRDKYSTSKKYMSYIREKGRLDQEWAKDKISDDEYYKKYDDIYNNFVKNIYEAKYDDYNRNTGKSKEREYAKEWLDSYGKDITIGFLKDLGYNDLSAKEIEARIRKSGMKVVI